ncbi:hypothetical protein FIA58_005120 [Flavobacterium jejuense]|uniref:Uncharacterized protein n=1 Tax=Flavobacterium jejuense TaxID=1544455 RepID=A0ABX0IQH5_9FLAO|nr:hypothetical protein [Flavobacterium jejuense]NHN25054.1 hypothetical protein [Flavobacterium jejuense]
MITGILIAVLFAFGVYIYKFPPRKTTSTPCPCSNKICMDYPDDSISKLSVDLIHTMVKGYKKNQLDFINTHSRFVPNDDAHSIWFDLETLKKFIYHIEKTTLNKAATVEDLKSMDITKEKLGIRIYYTAYPENKIWSRFNDLMAFLEVKDEKLKKERLAYGNLHSLVMVPTLDAKGNGTNSDFNPLDPITYPNGLFDRLGYTFDPNNLNSLNRTMGLSGLTSNQNLSTGAQNHGSLIPPATSNGVEGF